MGAFGGFVLTTKGRNLQAKAETGVRLNYTRMGIGDGQLAGQSIPTLNKLISEKKSLPITKLRIQTQGRAVIGAVLSNQDITTGFYFREIGIFAQDPDEGEILFCYGNSGTNAEYIPPTGGADLVEKSIDAIVIVGNATNVTATIDSSLIYATQDDVRDAEGRSKKYTDDKVMSIDSKLTGAYFLSEIKKVDGAGSELDADTLQGKPPSAFLEKASGGTVRGPLALDVTNRQLSVNTWGDLSASSGGQTLWGNNCYVDQNGKHRYSNTHQNIGAMGVRLNYGNIEIFDTGRIATTANAEFTPVWRSLVAAGGNGADLLDGFHASDFVKAVGMGTSGNTVPGDNWDNATTTGIYMSSSAASAPPSLPGSNSWFFGTAFEHNKDWVVQTLTDFNNVGQWTRAKTSGVWGPWKRTMRDDMIRINNGKLEFNDNGNWKPAGLGGAEGVPVGFATTATTWSKWTLCNDGVNTFAPYKDKLYCIDGSNLKKVELSDMSTLKAVAVSSPRSLAVYNDRIYVYSYDNNYSVFVYDLDLNPLYNKSVGLSFSAIAAANGAFYGVDSFGAISYFSLDLNLIRTVPRTGNEYLYTKLIVGPTGNLYYDYYNGNVSPYMYAIKVFDPQLNVIGNYSIANYGLKWTITATGTIGLVYKIGSWSDDPYYIEYIRPDGTRKSFNTNNTNLGAVGAGLSGGFYVFVNNTLDLYSDEGVPMISTKYNAYNSSNYNIIVPDSLGGVLALDRGSSSNGYLYRVMTRVKFVQP